MIRLPLSYVRRVLYGNAAEALTEGDEERAAEAERLADDSLVIEDDYPADGPIH